MASSGVNLKMGISGVQQFKQGIKESQQAVKTLEASFKLNEAAMKSSADQELYLQNKMQILTDKMEAQKRVIQQTEQALQAMSRNGTDKSSAAFQKMQEQMYKAQTELANTQNELAGIGEAGDEAANGVSELTHQLDNVSRNVSWDNVVEGISKITDSLEAAAQKAVQLGKKLVQAMLSGGQWADDLQTTADKWEMSPEQVYRMRQTANIIDTDAETIYQARQKLIKAMGQNDNKETMGAFAALGISDLNGSDANIENVFWKAGQGLMQMEDKVARNEYAMKLYGRSWNELIPIFKTGRETYNETMESWNWIGDEQFEKLTALDDENQKLTTEWENFQHQFEAALAPAMTQVMETLRGLLEQLNTYLASEDGQAMLDKLGEAVSGLFADLATIDPEQVVSGIVDLFDKIKGGFEWIITHKQDVVTALKVIAGGFAVLKLAEFAANLGRIVSGLGGLMGKGGNPVGGGDGTTVAPTGGAGGTGGSSGTTGTGFFAKMGMAMGAYAMDAANRQVQEFYNSAMNGLSLEEQQKKAFEQTFGVTQEQFEQWKTTQPTSLNNGSESLQRSLFGGAPTDYSPTEEQLAKAALKLGVAQEKMNPSADRMTEVAGQMTTAVTGTNTANAEMTSAVRNLNDLPVNMQTAITQAIIAGMSMVTITIDQGCVDTIGRSIYAGAGQLVKLITK